MREVEENVERYLSECKIEIFGNDSFEELKEIFMKSNAILKWTFNNTTHKILIATSKHFHIHMDPEAFREHTEGIIEDKVVKLKNNFEHEDFEIPLDIIKLKIFNFFNQTN